MRHFVIDGDGMLGGTGIRDAGEDEYVSPKELNLSVGLQLRIQNWLSEYQLEHWGGYSNDIQKIIPS